MRKTILALAVLETLGSAQAVSIGLTANSNSTVGLVTQGASNTLVSGNLYLFTSATDLTPGSLNGILSASNRLAFFASKLGTDPGQVRGPVAFTNGAFTSSGVVEVGAAGNNTYMFITSADGQWIGAFQNIDAPTTGTVVMNPSNMTEDLLGTTSLQGINGTNSGYQLVHAPIGPEIGIEQGAGNFLEINEAVDFGAIVPGQETSITFTIRNTGASPLVLSGTGFSAPHPDDFHLAAPMTGMVTAGGSLDFTVIFAPMSAGLRSSTFTLLNNDADENTFTFAFAGNALSLSTDTDMDGLSDASEFNMAALGFNWQLAQPALVSTYYTNANGAGLFTASQVQTLNSGTPLIARDPATGKFKLTLDWKKSTNLTSFVDFPAPVGSAVSISPQGDVEFEFPSTDNAAFFRIKLE
jgi:hypothetical protein